MGNICLKPQLITDGLLGLASGMTGVHCSEYAYRMSENIKQVLGTI
jgi:hypothetical protein